jgi:tRNA(adenine34) deaminase
MKQASLREPDDIFWMSKALTYAAQAASIGEVPVGAVLIKDNTFIAGGGNRPIVDKDPTSHAEIVTLRQAATLLNNYRLPDTTLYVTLEPCVMCIGAIIHARISRLVIGAKDPKSGAVYSVYNIGCDSKLNHAINIEIGVLEEECSQILKSFFRSRRILKKKEELK